MFTMKRAEMSRIATNRLLISLLLISTTGLHAIELRSVWAEDAATSAGAARRHESHPIDAAMAMAQEGLRHIREDVRDYTATVIKRERIAGKVGDPVYMQIKIRHEQKEQGRVVVPFSVYIRFLLPKSWEGREAIWVEGRNGDQIIAHDRGILNLLRLRVNPRGRLAMFGNRYPITEIGVLNLVEKLVERAQRERQSADGEVRYLEDAKVDGRPCTLIQVTHQERTPESDFYRARIFVDKQLNLPIRYAAWDWPADDGGPPQLLEEYTYRDVQINVGLTDQDFDPDNPAYDYP
jgi:hypothetical protein